MVKRKITFFKKGIKYCFYILASAIIYVLFSILISYSTVNKNSDNVADSETIYIHSNGVHLSVILAVKSLSDALRKDLTIPKHQKYARFGWGDKNFYLNVPTWNDFKFKYAFGALFLNNPTVINVTAEFAAKKSWVAVKVSEDELLKINTFLTGSFEENIIGNKITVPQDIYGPNAFFYKAKGSYSPIKTCNTWANDCFKQSGLKASYWTLFDFGLLDKYTK